MLLLLMAVQTFKYPIGAGWGTVDEMKVRLRYDGAGAVALADVAQY